MKLLLILLAMLISINASADTTDECNTNNNQNQTAIYDVLLDINKKLEALAHASRRANEISDAPLMQARKIAEFFHRETARRDAQADAIPLR